VAGLPAWAVPATLVVFARERSFEEYRPLNAKGKRDAFMFDPDDLVLVTDEKSPLYDDRVELPIDESLVMNIMFAPLSMPLSMPMTLSWPII